MYNCSHLLLVWGEQDFQWMTCTLVICLITSISFCILRKQFPFLRYMSLPMRVIPQINCWRDWGGRKQKEKNWFSSGKGANLKLECEIEISILWEKRWDNAELEMVSGESFDTIQTNYNFMGSDVLIRVCSVWPNSQSTGRTQRCLSFQVTLSTEICFPLWFRF